MIHEGGPFLSSDGSSCEVIPVYNEVETHSSLSSAQEDRGECPFGILSPDRVYYDERKVQIDFDVRESVKISTVTEIKNLGFGEKLLDISK